VKFVQINKVQYNNNNINLLFLNNSGYYYYSFGIIHELKTKIWKARGQNEKIHTVLHLILNYTLVFKIYPSFDWPLKVLKKVQIL